MFGRKKPNQGDSNSPIDPKIAYGYGIAAEELSVLIRIVADHRAAIRTELVGSGLDVDSLLLELARYKATVAERIAQIAVRTDNLSELASEADTIGDRMSETFDKLAVIQGVGEFLPEGGFAGFYFTSVPLEREAKRLAGKSNA